MDIKVLIVGYGSIGRRHLASFKRVRPNNQYAILRRQESSDASPESMRCFTKLEQVAEFSPDLICFCTPSQTHSEDLERFSPYLKNVFVEKPLACSYDQLQKAESVLSKISGRFFYGCVMRFHPAVAWLKKVTESQIFGKAIHYIIECGSYLPDWRPEQDYRKSYCASASSQGVTLDLIHEFDYAEWCFGPIDSISGKRGKISHLEIQSDDYCDALISHENNLSGIISINYFQRKATRSCKVTFERASIGICLISGDVFICEEGKKEVVEKFPISRDSQFDFQSQAMFDTIEKSAPSAWDVVSARRLIEKVLLI